MPKFRKKPVVIDAVQWTGAEIKGGPPLWLLAARGKDPRDAGAVSRLGDELLIHTLEGTMTAFPGDWIIRGVDREIYPCKPHIFAATYESAD